MADISPRPDLLDKRIGVVTKVFKHWYIYNLFGVGYTVDDFGGFQLLNLIITELKSHMTCYNSMTLIALVEITAFTLESKSCKGFFLKNKIFTDERNWIFNRSCDF